jgi:hypothetical protein
MKTFVFYLKQLFLPVMYTIFAMCIALGILCITDPSLLWLKVVLLVLNLGLLGFIFVVNYEKEGEKALKVRIANDFERRHIIETGDDRPLNLCAEYKPWKGFVIGIVACAPLLLLLIAHTIVILIDPEYLIIGGVSSFMYMSVFGFYFIDTSIKLTAASFYFSLVYVPFAVCTIGIPYYFGGKKIEAQQRAIEQKHREIYGE